MWYSGPRSCGRSVIATLASTAILAGVLIGVGQSPAAAVTPPVAVDDTYTTNFGEALVQGTPGVLANDTDDVGPITASGASTPAHGTVNLNPNGSFTYSPQANFVGNDTFTYTVSDGVDGSDTGLVTVTVSPNAAEDINPSGPGCCGRWVDIGGGNAISLSTSTVAGVGGVYKTDLTAAGTVQVKNVLIAFTTLPQLPPIPAGTGKWVFPVTDTAGGTGELWVTDGTAAGTMLLKDINPSGDSFPRQMTALGNQVLFEAFDPTNGTELWTTDGTPAGTMLLKDINPGTGSSNPNCGNTSTCNGFTVWGSKIVFAANDGTNGTELWTSDGTPAGTSMINVNPGAGAGSTPTSFGFLGSTLLFRADGGGSLGAELWKSDGTQAGTVLVKDIRTGVIGSSVSTPFAIGGGIALFAADNGALGDELWKTDGTAAGTVLLKEIRPNSTTTSNIGNFANVVGTTIFTANDGGATCACPGPGVSLEFWKTDGTAAGTVPLKDINPTGGSIPVIFPPITQIGSVAYFSASDGTTGSAHGSELWKTDGTTAGTVLAKDINPGTGSSLPSSFSTVLGTMLFAATDATPGGGPWRLAPLNTAPVAVNDAYSTNEDTALTINAPGVVSNDTDANSNVLHDAIKFTDPAHGSVTFNGDGSFTYTPAANYNGPDSFTYRSFDGMDYSNAATVNITVNAVADAPVAVNDSYSTVKDVPLTVTAPGVLSNDTDGDADPLTAGSATTSANGALTLNADGSFTYTPNAGFVGNDSFTYKANDGTADSNVATVTIAVTVPTVSASPGTVTAGNPVTATWSGIANPTATDWVGLYDSSSAPDPALLAWSYTAGGSAGSLNLTVPLGATPGATYELRLFANNTYTRLATSAPFTVTASATTISASPASVPAGGSVTATWAGIASPTAVDWVGLYDSPATPDAGVLAWAYTGGGAAGNLNLGVPLGSASGAGYELRLFANNSYTRLATSAPFAGVASNPAVSASPGSVPAGGPLTATWSGIPAPSATDWVGLYANSSDPNAAIVAWTYTTGTAGGNLPLTVPSGATPGATYELRLFSNNTYSRLATSAPFTVTASVPATISSSVATVANGNPLTATWSGIASPSATDWVGLYAASGDPDPAIVAWVYTGGGAAGSVNLVVPLGSPPGATYELRLYSNNTYTRLATSAPFSVT